MRVLHTSDWHLGRTIGEASLETEQRAMLRFVVDTLVDDPHDVLVVAGDVFDRSVPSETAVSLWSDFLRDFRSRAPRVPLVAIAGNHDNATRLATAATVLEDLDLHVRGDANAVDRPIRIRTTSGEEADLFAIPFLWPGALNAHRDGEATRLSTQVSALGEAIARIDAALDPSRIAIAVAHCLVLGGLASDSERVLVGTATSVDAALFDRFDYTALGHLHRSQKVGARVHYSGSPLAYSFSEAGDSKGLLSVEVGRGKAPRIRVIPVRGMRGLVELRGRLHDLLADTSLAPYETFFVRAVLLDEVAPVAPMKKLRERFPFTLESPWQRPGSGAREAEAGRLRVVTEHATITDEWAAFEARIGRDVEAETGIRDAFAAIHAKVESEPGR